MGRERDPAAGGDRRETQGRRAWIRIDKATASPASTHGVYDVAITGVNLHMAQLKPQTRKLERRTLNFSHAEEVDIESASRFESGASAGTICA